MSRGTRPRRRTGVYLSTALALASTLPPGSAPAAASRPSDAALSPRLAELAKPSVRSAPPAKQAERLGVAKRGPGSLLREGNRVLVEVRFDRGAAAGIGDLRAAGARIVHVSPRYQTVTVAVRPDQLRRLSNVPRVAGATEVLAPIVYSAEEPGPVTSAITPCFGAATSEGDEQLRAAQARAEFEVDGSGVTVGILSDSFNQNASADTHEAEDIASGDLPGSLPKAVNPCGRTTPVNVLEDFESPEATDEGRAMAQIVHDLAPGATLAFATAFKSHLAFAENIERLAEPVVSGGGGANVIVDDVAYFNEPFFQDGPIAVAADNVTASGSVYFSAAGNENLIDAEGHDIASWEAPEFRDSLNCPPALALIPGLGATHCMDFNPNASGVDNTFGITVEEGGTLGVDLQWAEPWYGVETDLDVFLLDEEGEPIEEEGFLVGSGDDNVDGLPFEFFLWENTGPEQEVQVAINRCSVACNPEASGTATPRLKFILAQSFGIAAIEYPISSEGDTVGSTIFGHSGAEQVMSLGAIRYNTTSAPEQFSSRGPVTHYFGPVEGTTPAAPLGSPQIISKPDLVATDGGANTFFGQCFLGAWRFFGTSAAAPHAAAVAALQREAAPAASAGEVKDAQREGAVDVGSPPKPEKAVGAGLLDAVNAIEELEVAPSAPGASAEEPPAPVSCTSSEEEPGPEPDEQNESDSNGGAGPVVVLPPPPPDPAPHTFIKKRPGKVVFTPWRRGRAAFGFRSNEPGVLFFCQFDRMRWRRCGPWFVRWFKVGRHVLRVKARDAAGNLDPTPAVHRFRVRRVSKERFARLKRANRRARHERR